MYSTSVMDPAGRWRESSRVAEPQCLQPCTWVGEKPRSVSAALELTRLLGNTPGSVSGSVNSGGGELGRLGCRANE